MKENDNKIDLTVYRKPSVSLNTIPNTACSPKKYKLSAYQFLVRRAFKTCTNKYLNLELKKIKDIAFSNGFSNKTINDIIWKHRNCSNLNPKESQLTHKRFSVQYFPGFYERLHFKLKKFNIDIIAKPPLKLKDFLSDKNNTPNEDLTGVYEIPFIKQDGSTSFYIGMTGRKFKVRLKEHKTDIKFGRNSTALARLNNTENIKICFDESRVISSSFMYYPNIIRETIEILTREDICNENTSFNLDKMWINLIKDFNRP